MVSWKASAESALREELTSRPGHMEVTQEDKVQRWGRGKDLSRIHGRKEQGDWGTQACTELLSGQNSEATSLH